MPKKATAQSQGLSIPTARAITLNAVRDIAFPAKEGDTGVGASATHTGNKKRKKPDDETAKEEMVAITSTSASGGKKRKIGSLHEKTLSKSEGKRRASEDDTEERLDGSADNETPPTRKGKSKQSMGKRFSDACWA